MTVRRCAEIWVKPILFLSGSKSFCLFLGDRSVADKEVAGLETRKRWQMMDFKLKCGVVGVPECLTRPAGSFRQLTFTLAVVSLHQAVDYYR